MRIRSATHRGPWERIDVRRVEGTGQRNGVREREDVSQGGEVSAAAWVIAAKLQLPLAAPKHRQGL